MIFRECLSWWAGILHERRNLLIQLRDSFWKRCDLDVAQESSPTTLTWKWQTRARFNTFWRGPHYIPWRFKILHHTPKFLQYMMVVHMVSKGRLEVKFRYLVQDKWRIYDKCRDRFRTNLVV